MSGIYWLASYPKSGNTWLRVLLTNYLRNDDKPADINDLDISTIGFNRDVFDECLGIESSDLTEKQIEYYRPSVYEKMADEISEPLFLKIHDAYFYNAEDRPIFSKTATAGAIYLVRNPLDVAVSYAHHQDEPIDKIIRLMNEDDAFLAGSEKDGGQLLQKLSSWSNHVKSWTNEPDLNIHVVRYEDLLLDTIKEFSKIVKFAGLEFDPKRIEKSVEFSRFEQLKKQETVHGFNEKQPTAKSFFRRGRANSWRGTLSPRQIKQIISNHRTVMKYFRYLDSENKILT